MKELEIWLKDVTDKQLEKQIAILDENIATIKSSRTTVIDLKTYKKVRNLHNSLTALMRKRNGSKMPEEPKQPAD